MAQSDVPAEKIAAFMKTNYIVLTEQQDFTLRIGNRSPALSALYKKTNTTWSAFITAYNPLSSLQDHDTNEAANKRLFDKLSPLYRHVFQGNGADPKGLWPPEPSFFVLGIDLVPAKLLGEQFRQDAIIWVDSDAIPQLILLR